MKEVLYTKDNEAYQVKRVLVESKLKNPDTKILKKWFRCDEILRNMGKLYLCNHIKSIKFKEIK